MQGLVRSLSWVFMHGHPQIRRESFASTSLVLFCRVSEVIQCRIGCRVVSAMATTHSILRTQVR